MKTQISESQIRDNAVGFGKMRDVSSNIILGRLSDGVGDIEELTLSTLIDMLGVSGSKMTNKSGSIRSIGDVVIFDTSSNMSFKTTSFPLDLRVCGVLGEEIENDNEGIVITNAGTIVTVNCNTSAVEIGQYLITSTTPGLATSGGYFRTEGTFGIALSAKSAGSNGTVSVMLIDNYRQAISGNLGYALGGTSTGGVSTVAQRFAIATANWSGSPSANLVSARTQTASMTHGTVGIFIVGSSLATGEFMSFATETTSIAGGITVSSYMHYQRPSASGSNRGYVCGGNTNTAASPVVVKITYATGSSSSNAGLSSGREYQVSVSDGAYVYVRGSTSVICDRITLSTDTVSANSVGNLPAANRQLGTFAIPTTAGYEATSTVSRKIIFSTGADAAIASTPPTSSGYSAGITNGLSMAWLCGGGISPYQTTSKFDVTIETYSADAGASMTTGVYGAAQGSYATFS